MHFKKLFLVLVVIFSVQWLFSQEIIANIADEQNSEVKSEENLNESDVVISGIKFLGLKKTKESYIQPKYEKYIGKKSSEIDIHALETELQMEGLFEKTEIKIEGSEIEITVVEKITFIPLPFAMWSSKGFMAGLMVMDTNAFGVKDTFMLGGFYSSESITGMALFSKPPVDKKPGFSAFLATAKNEPEIKDIENEDVAEYENLAFGAKLSLIEKLSKSNAIKFSLGVDILNTDEDEVKISSVDSAKIGQIGLSYSFSKSDWNGWFISTSGANVNANFSKYFGLDSDSDLSSFVQNYSANLSFQKPLIWDRLRFSSHISTDFLVSESEKSAHIAEYKEGGSVGVTIFPGNFKTDSITGGSAGLEVALKKFSFGLLSFYGNYEIAWAKDFSFNSTTKAFEDLEFCHGINSGIRLYLSKIAFPALAMGSSYNFSKKYSQFSFAMGISM